MVDRSVESIYPSDDPKKREERPLTHPPRHGGRRNAMQNGRVRERARDDTGRRTDDRAGRLDEGFGSAGRQAR